MRDGLPVVRNEATCASASGQEGNYDRGGRSHQMSMSSSTCLPSEVTNTVEIFSIRTTNPTIGLTYRVYSSGIKIHKASTIHINLDVAVHQGCPLATILPRQAYLPSPGYGIRKPMYSETLRIHPHQVWIRIKRSHTSRHSQLTGGGRLSAGDIIEEPRSSRIGVITRTV